jgi:AGZA family xanthine/uracil permease-like MFS transporter
LAYADLVIGSLMAQSAKDINWKYMGDAIPAFLTIAVMPFTYSIAYGLIAGICSYILINTLVFVIEKASGGRIVPPNKEEKEPWTWRIPGGVLPPWVQRALRGKKDFWKEDELSDGVETVERKSERSSADQGLGKEIVASNVSHKVD